MSGTLCGFAPRGIDYGHFSGSRYVELIYDVSFSRVLKVSLAHCRQMKYMPSLGQGVTAKIVAKIGEWREVRHLNPRLAGASQ